MIVVTGAAGHVGNVLTRRLLNKKYKVRGIISPSGYSKSIEELNIEKVQADITDLNSLITAFKGADIVYHLAALISITPKKENLLYKINVQGTKNVIEAAFKAKVKRLIYVSSIDAIAIKDGEKIVDETTPFDPDKTFGIYGKTKALASLEILKAVKKGLNAVIFSPTAILGPCDFKPSLFGEFILNFIKNKFKFYIEGGFDFVDVRDVAKVLVASLRKGERGKNYIISGKYHSLQEIIFLLEKSQYYKKGYKIKIPDWFMNIALKFSPLYYTTTNTTPLFTKDSIQLIKANIKINNSKTKKEFLYQPTNIKKTIKDTLEWFKSYKNF